MLRSITVENYALIDHLEMRLDERLNIITGETGAGKSILLGALGLLLGNKNDGSAIKDNTKSCVIEGSFDISSLSLKPLFEERDWEWEESLTIRRVISPSGKSRAFVGDIPATLSDLKELGARLIDIHSQHQNMSLSSEAFRIETIDTIGENTQLMADYRALYHTLQGAKAELSKFEEQSARSARDEEWLTFQVEELEGAKLKEGEDKRLEEELQVLDNADRIGEVLATLQARLEAEEVGVLSLLKGSLNELKSIAPKFSAADDYAQRVESTLAELKDINDSVGYHRERVEADPERLQKLSQRLDVIYSLSQKHRAQDLSELIKVRDEYIEKLSLITRSDEHIEDLKSRVRACETEAMKVAEEVERRRKAAAGVFEVEVTRLLSLLGMGDATIKVDISRQKSLTPTGVNSVDFLFSANKSKSAQPIDKIASGGEMSRVMLSVKALLSKHRQLPTIIFDEIDTGVSGHIADAMGEIISQLSLTLQVVDITHLAQVASKGDTHFVVYKQEGRTNIKRLSDGERIEQIATMISGAQISSAAIEQAKILLSRK